MKVVNLIFFLFLLCSVVNAQEVQVVPQPTPTPIVKKRPPLDQFDVPGGVHLPTPVATQVDDVIVDEPLDPSICHGVVRMISYASSFERDYLAAKPDGIPTDHHFHPDNAMFRKLDAAVSIILLFEKGGFGEQVKGAGNLKILEENRRIAVEMMNVLEMFAYKDRIPYNTGIATIADSYNVAPEKGVSAEKIVGKRTLLAAMLARLNGNFARLEKRTGCIRPISK